MKEGWHNDEYFILYESQLEAEQATARYGLADHLPGYLIVGLKGWDDFILCDNHSKYHTVPTVPLVQDEVRSFIFPAEKLELKSDDGIANKIKWYVTPIVFNGSPTAKENTAWIAYEQHVEAVRWWNKIYLEIKNKAAGSAGHQ